MLNSPGEVNCILPKYLENEEEEVEKVEQDLSYGPDPEGKKSYDEIEALLKLDASEDLAAFSALQDAISEWPEE